MLMSWDWRTGNREGTVDLGTQDSEKIVIL
jgi:hypothetical protein